VAPYRAKTPGNPSGESAWLPIRENRGYLYGER